MRMDRGQQPSGVAFREAISQWQLAARTEVKRSSSLPSSMFDACDPMLEARLADSVEAMLTCLQQPSIDIGARGAALEQRTETVMPSELRQLPARIGPTPTDSPRIDASVLDDGVSTEYLGELIDLCGSAEPAAARDAARLLHRDFGIRTDLDLDATARALAACLTQLTNDSVQGCSDELADRLDTAVRTIAANVIRQARPTATEQPQP